MNVYQLRRLLPVQRRASRVMRFRSFDYGPDQSLSEIGCQETQVGVDSQSKKGIFCGYVIFVSVSSMQRKRDDDSRGSDVPQLRTRILA